MKLYCSVEWFNKPPLNICEKRKKGKKGKKGKIYCDSFSMELSVAIYQNNPSKVGKTIRPDSKYNRAGNNSKSGKDDFVDENHFFVDISSVEKWHIMKMI